MVALWSRNSEICHDLCQHLQAIHVVELVTFLASVNHVGNSSMEMGKKVKVLPWMPATDDQRRHSAQTLLRRRLRDELQPGIATAGARG